ncbi:MAG: DUF1800 family protein [Saprospiraceae bacterium]
MNRRQLFQSLSPTKLDMEDRSQAIPVGGGLNPYTGTWNYATAAHLLRRAMFGPTHEQIKQAVSDGLNATITKLFTKTANPSPPLTYANNVIDPYSALGETWVGKRFTPSVQGLNQLRDNSLFSWALQNAFNEGVSITEKMMLFWHNHFVVSDIYLANLSYDYLSTIRKNVLGDFKQMAKDITVDGAMLMYLNGETNTKVAPNENYARELMELFTLGKGELAGPGDYTTYTEQDILAIAKVLTGWSVLQNRDPTDGSVLTTVKFNTNPRNGQPQSNHDTTTKQLSARFNFATIANANEKEYENLIDIIFQKREAATFICRKFYRYFVYYKVDLAIENDIIDGLADILIANDFKVDSVLRKLLSSDHFYSNEAYGAIIRPPYDWFFNTVKAMKMAKQTDMSLVYNLFLSAYRNILPQSQAYFGLPSVAGWPAYYQEPAYHEIWVNSISYPLRYTFGQTLINKKFGFRINGQGSQIYGVEVAEYAAGFDTPGDATKLVADIVAHLLPQAIQQSQLDFLKAKLLGNMTEAQWLTTWNTYKNNPSNVPAKTAVETRLRPFLVTLTSMPEYHLS